MWFKLIFFVFLILICAPSTNGSANLKSNQFLQPKELNENNLFEWILNLFSIYNDDNCNFERVKSEKMKIRNQIKQIVNQHQNEIIEREESGDKDDNYHFNEIRNAISEILDAETDLEQNKIIGKLINMIEVKIRNGLNKLLLQEAMLCKINDSADRFETLDKIRSKLKFGDIIEFKRLGYSHFSIYLGNNKSLTYENPMYKNLSWKNILSDFESLTLIESIDIIANNNLVRVNNKLNLKLPVNKSEINLRIQEAIKKNSTTKYNVFFNNCEHFAMFIRFGCEFSDQVKALLEVAKDIMYPIENVFFEVFRDN